MKLWESLLARFWRHEQRIKLGATLARPTSMLDSYVRVAPTPQNVVDIFKGEWASQFPEPLSDIQAGTHALFDDVRIHWLQKMLGGLEGQTVLELGPLEGGHSYQLERYGATTITAIEANTRAYLRCLIVKELLDLRRVRFVCGDFVEYLRQGPEPYDIGVASGVLYHMQNPVELLGLLAQYCRKHIFLWTHYYDAALLATNEAQWRRFIGKQVRSYNGYEAEVYCQAYRESVQAAGYCGGSHETSCWMTRDGILDGLQHFGFEIAGIEFDQHDHPHGPAFTVLATRPE